MADWMTISALATAGGTLGLCPLLVVVRRCQIDRSNPR
jgi:hypothetical protein